MYTVAIDQDGQVSFAGERCTAQLGVSNKSVPEADARAVYDALRSTAFASLKDRYLTMEDGCDRVATDHPTSTWTVEADGFEKSMERYHGCDGPAALDEVDAVETVLHMRAAIRAWLEPPLSNCD